MMSSKLASIDVGRSANEIHGVMAKKRLKNVRQMVNRHPPYGIKWLVQEDLIEEFIKDGVTDRKKATRRAQRIWDRACFDLQIYRTGFKTKTRAEFLLEWLQSGFTWEDSINHLKTLSLTTVPKRALPPNFKDDAKNRLRAKAAKTYVARAVDDG